MIAPEIVCHCVLAISILAFAVIVSGSLIPENKNVEQKGEGPGQGQGKGQGQGYVQGQSNFYDDNVDLPEVEWLIEKIKEHFKATGTPPKRATEVKWRWKPKVKFQGHSGRSLRRRDADDDEDDGSNPGGASGGPEEPESRQGMAEINIGASENLPKPKFKEALSWGSIYDNCNPGKNEFLSPININTSSALLDKKTPTLFVYSSHPIRDYKLSLSFMPEGLGGKSDPEHELDALNIRLNGEKFQEATYVSGLGDVSYRFFMFALFLFAKDKAALSEEERAKLSLHRMNGHEIAMEIVLYFATKNTVDDTTQIHVMVNISDTNTDNPLFYPIVKAAEDMQERTRNYKQTEVAVSTQLEHVTKLADAFVTKMEKRAKDGFTEDYIKNLAAAILTAKEIETQIDTDTHFIANMEATNKGIDDFITTKAAENDKNAAEIKKLAATILAKKEEEEILLNNTESYNFQKASQIQAQIQALEKEHAKTVAELLTANDEVERNQVDQEQNLKDIKSKQEEVEANKQKIVKAFSDKRLKVSTSEAAHKALYDIWMALNEEQTDQKAIKKQENIWRDLQNELHIEKDLEIFQASWLLPPTGGYYIYNGSLPVPPCTRRGFTIVMDTPIYISQAQFDTLTSIGHLENKEPVEKCLPVLAQNSESRTVWHNPKNLQYILDDAVHMKSKRRKKIKIQMRRNGAKSIFGSSRFEKKLLVILIAFLISTTVLHSTPIM